MKKTIIVAAIVLAGCQAQLNTESESAATDVILRNNAPNSLVCYQVVKEGENESVGSVLFEIGGMSYRKLENSSAHKEIACQFETQNKHHTFLTYFNILNKGEYQLTLEEIKCNSCGKLETRPATIVQFPNGKKQDEVF